MKRILVALVALAAACSSEKERSIQYGAPAAPSLEEQGAAATAQATLESNLAFAPAPEPSTGAPGLADQLVAQLGAYEVAKAMPTGSSAKVAASATSRAIMTGGLDPQCVATTATSVTWSGCVLEDATTDPYTGATSTMKVTVDGTLTSDPATGRTAWRIHETMAMTETQGPDTTTMDVAADLEGAITTTPSTITGGSTSNVTARASFSGMRMSEGIRTTLSLDLDYVADPFCVTSGTLVLEQRWTERPLGANPTNLPDQGWRFEWTGCGQVTVAHGS